MSKFQITEISAIYLHHDYIGMGYGHELLEEIEGMLVAKGIKSLQMLRRKGREESSREI